MLTSAEGVYRNGQITLKEPPANLADEVPVIVTFMSSSDVDLRVQGISHAGAAELLAALFPFEDWDEPEMDVYDDYDAAESKL